MDKLYECAIAFSHLLDIQYNIIIGRKNKIINLSVAFSKSDFHHLIGLHKLYDYDYLHTGNRGKIFDDIINKKITYSSIAGNNGFSRIANRFEPLIFLENLLDDNKMIFRYNTQTNTFSLIQAKYLLCTPYNKNTIYIFLDKNNSNGTYFCRSFFPQGNKDYTVGQTRYALLYKEKVNKKTGEVEVQLNRNDICHFMEIAQKEYEAMLKAKLDITVQSQTESGIRIRYFASDEQAVSDCLALANKESQNDFLFRIVTEAEHKKLKDANFPFDTKRTEKGIVIRYSSQLKDKIERTLSPPRGKQAQKPHIKR